MSEIPVYNITGNLIEKVTVDPEVFDVPANPSLLHQVVVALMSQRRSNLAHTKHRGDVRGGGKKPWKQKGTGRARQGSIRSPQWRGGGVVFGPRKDANYAKKINKVMKHQALLIVLSDRVRNNACAIVDGLSFTEPKTKLMSKAMQVLGGATKLPFTDGVLVVRSAKDDQTIGRVSRNIPFVKVSESENLGLEEILKKKVVLFTRAGFKEVSSRLAK